MPRKRYRWICKRCKSANDALADWCSHCRCPAVIAPAELPEASPLISPGHFLTESRFWINYFPEWLLAAGLALAAPVWAIRLLWQGHIGLGLFLIAGGGVAGYAAYCGIVGNNKLLTWLAMMGFLVVGVIVLNSAPH